MGNIVLRAIALVYVAAIQIYAHAATGAGSFPAKPVRLVVPTAPGGGVDTAARILGQKLTETWNQQVVVDNRGGASGVIGTEIVAHAPADGYTLLITPTTFSTTKNFISNISYDPATDFAAVSLVSREPNILLTHPSVRASSLKELIALAKRKPDAFNFSSGGVGSTASLCAELFKLRTGLRVPVLAYKGAGPAVNALVGGEVQMMFVGLPPTLPLIKAGKLRALAVTGQRRSSFLPNIPTMAEAGMNNFEVTNWIGLLAPSGIPQAVLRRINGAVRRALESDEVRKRFAGYGVVPDPTTPEEFGKFVQSEIKRWEGVIKAAHLKPQ